MGKKEKLERNKKDRLDKIFKEWERSENETNNFSTFKNIDVLDLRLLLENKSPAQDIIRSIVLSELQANFPDQHYAMVIKSEKTDRKDEDLKELQEKNRVLEEKLEKINLELSKTNKKLKDEQIALASIQEELLQTQAEQAEKNKDLEKFLQAAKETESALSACSTQVERLLTKEDAYKQDIKTLKDERKQLKTDLAAAQARNQAAPVVTFLRKDYALAQAMSLDDLSTDDTQALIQIVAILAQIDNIQRLWETLKERCEKEKRAATSDESALLQTALSWYNLNWRSHPHRLIEVSPGSRYDYETQTRISHVTKGEIVTTMCLQGIANSQGSPLCKAIVLTK